MPRFRGLQAIIRVVSSFDSPFHAGGKAFTRNLKIFFPSYSGYCRTWCPLPFPSKMPD